MIHVIIPMIKLLPFGDTTTEQQTHVYGKEKNWLTKLKLSVMIGFN